MPSPLQPGDHYVLRKLCDQLLPWMISGKIIGRQWFVRLAIVYSYTIDLAAALAGLGIGAPIAALIQGQLPKGQSNALDVLHSVLPPGWFYVGIVAAIFWIVLRVVVKKQDVERRALLARGYALAMSESYAKLDQALADSEPMPQIRIIQKSVEDRYHDAINKGVWKWDPPFPPSAEIETELKETVDYFRSKFMSNWAPPPPGALP